MADLTLKQAIQQIALRTERVDYDSAVASFYDCNIISHLTNVNHQIIQGRRGTGKTHILYFLKNTLENTGCHCIYFDCKSIGSIQSISNHTLQENYRAIQLIRDFLFALHSDLLKYYKDDIYDAGDNNEIESLLDHLFNECRSTGQIIEHYEKTNRNKEHAMKSTIDSLSFHLPNFLCEFQSKKERNLESDKNYKSKGIVYDEIIFPNVLSCLNRLAEITKKEYVILIDEWSSLPLDVQPHFAEFLRHSFFASKSITVKIAVVTGRTRYCLPDNIVTYGFEIGADISVSMDLDNLYMFDKHPKKVFSDLFGILLKHLHSQNVVTNMDVSEFLAVLFQDRKSSFLLVRASEGNPRDFISIIDRCIVELDGIGNSDKWIDSQIVYNAATKWYESDKKHKLTSLQGSLLSEIFAYIVDTKHTRGFVIEESYLSHIAFRSLIDARVLHIVQTGLHFPQYSKYTMAILILDFGTYASYLIGQSGTYIYLQVIYLKRRFFHTMINLCPLCSCSHLILTEIFISVSLNQSYIMTFFPPFQNLRSKFLNQPG